MSSLAASGLDKFVANFSVPHLIYRYKLLVYIALLVFEILTQKQFHTLFLSYRLFSILYDSKELETHKSVGNEWINKLFGTHSGILLSLQKEGGSNTRYSTHEP